MDQGCASSNRVYERHFTSPSLRTFVSIRAHILSPLLFAPPSASNNTTELRLLGLDFVCVLVRLWQVALCLRLGLLLLLVGLVEALLLVLGQLLTLTSSLEVALHEVHEHVALEHVGEEEQGDRGGGVDAVEQAQDSHDHDHETGHHEDNVVEPLSGRNAVLLVEDLGQHEDVRNEVTEVVQGQQTDTDTVESRAESGNK